MNRLVVLCAALCPLAAFAVDEVKDEAAQRKADAAAVKACQLAKDAILKQAACEDEGGVISAIICSDNESRASVNPAKLKATCDKKVKAAKAKAPVRKKK